MRLDYGSYGAGGSGAGGIGGGGGSSSFRDDNSRRGFEEYDAGDDEVVGASIHHRSTSTASSTRHPPARKVSVPTPAPAIVPEVNLLDGFDDDSFVTTPPSKSQFATDKALPAVSQAPLAAKQSSFGGIDGQPVSAPSIFARAHVTCRALP